MGVMVGWWIDFYVLFGIVMIYKQFIVLFKEFGVKFILELKLFKVEMLFDGFL